METSVDTANAPEKTSNKKTIVIVGAILVVLLGAAAAILLSRPSLMDIEDGDVPLQYAMEGVMILEEDDSYHVLDANAVALEYKNDAYSKDGKTFTCYLGNSALNEYDAFVAIYADPTLEDLLCLTDLIPPGSGFEKLTLNRKLEVGTNRVYIAFTQVEDAATNTLHGQTLYTMDFHVLAG